MHGVRVRTMSRSLGLMPAAPSKDLDDLGDDCGRHFEPLRAPISSADRERGLAPGRTAGNRTSACWGCRFVLEDFCFHMTLAGRSSPMSNELLQVRPGLEAVRPVDTITLVVRRSPPAISGFRWWRAIPSAGVVVGVQFCAGR